MSFVQPLFELRQVSQRFDRFSALHDVTLQIYEGERVALVGSSGAGKSTLIRLLNGTLRPTEGEVWALGRNLSGLSARQLRQVQRQIGTVYQQFHLVDNLAVIHNVNAGHLGRWPLFKALVSLVYPLEVKTAADALERVGIPEKLYARTDRLSGGQQQRVALARVLVQNPQAILADEPVASLDRELSREVMDLLCKLVEANKTLVVSLHSVELAQRYCDRIIGLRHGTVQFDVPSSNVSSALLEDLYRLR
ncbi:MULTISPECIES: phosphonate ABC transporter ATP-binding protein [unclassified Leptolyngbya]|uniref:phosphonate ABC transporter ATP-binding protein n=1 Tax=unclassified Leptolyngbya TaxID=2650499 RepID=UPI001688C901|nr:MULTISPECIES: phosphonate ABC transporter ATP-binding protein [unclassified Leptolyngbya]MBD1910598.1 phosphonate ABC transporter ATP-binding protein [Leptolyngbya sp. FACHB-8]MBD2154538.1 phosphonate ABC transporter ATP-binding protein [Leptolyngbya sp. FACHB-16]